jgi:CheY-like chemotaxis protein
MEQLKDGDEQVREDLREIQSAGERAAGLTRQLLAFSRKQIVQTQLVDLNESVAQISKMLRRLLGEDINLVVTPAEAPGTVEADCGQIEQVIANLAVNARDAMLYGGTLKIDTCRVNIDETFVHPDGVAVAPGAYVALAVHDTGTGMDEATRRQIFEPFFTTKGPGKGTGLGLSTVYGIIEQSGGFIVVESAVGRGTRFIIYLPYAADAPAPLPSVTRVAARHGSETILVVEDVIGLRRLMARTLAAAGYSVLTAASGEEALRLLEQYEAPLHLMITDVVMPGMSCRNLAERFAQLRPALKVVYMSGYTDDVIVRHKVLGEGVPFVSKPFGAADLLRTVRRTLDAPPSSQ